MLLEAIRDTLDALIENRICLQTLSRRKKESLEKEALHKTRESLESRLSFLISEYRSERSVRLQREVRQKCVLAGVKVDPTFLKKLTPAPFHLRKSRLRKKISSHL